ncbi:MAG: hypothetical protein OXK80_02505 [Bdellovibrionales bacterium]|nr:hypothetical protein [Bdellovibrionales bacterium]
MSYEFYKILHLISLIALFLSLGMLIIGPKPFKKIIMSLHGTALLLLFVSGFGLIAKLHIPLKILSPLWFWQKTLVWVVLIGLTPLFLNKKEKPMTAKKITLFISILLALALYAVWQVTYR